VRGPATPARLAALVAGLGALLAAALGVGLAVGPSGLDPGEVLRALSGREDGVAADIVLRVRLPRVLLAALVGASLATAGTLFQALLRNPLADPYLVGVGPGALLGAAAAGAFGLAGETLAGFRASAVAAFAGAALAAFLVLGVAGRGGRAAPARLLLAGVAVGSFVTAVSTWALYVKGQSWQDAVHWLLGSLAWAEQTRVTTAAAAALGLTAVAWWRARDLDALALGEEAARLGGLDTARAIPLLAVAGCLLTAAAVSTAGLVGFVGLVVPHAARRLAGPSHRGLVPVAALLGGGLLVLADAVARVVARVEIPVGVVTALLGAPAFALLVRRGGRA
jgi:iron complex transport system permease protein